MVADYYVSMGGVNTPASPMGRNISQEEHFIKKSMTYTEIFGIRLCQSQLRPIQTTSCRAVFRLFHYMSFPYSHGKRVSIKDRLLMSE